MRKKELPFGAEFIEEDNRPVSEEVKMADYIYFSNDKAISYDLCEKVAKRLIENGYGNIRQAVKKHLEKVRKFMAAEMFPITIFNDGRIANYIGIGVAVCEVAKLNNKIDNLIKEVES